MGSVVGLQQLLRMQGIEWGDSGRGGGDSHAWFDGGGSFITDAIWTPIGGMAESFSLPVGVTSSGVSATTATLPNGGTVVGQAAARVVTLNLAVQSADFTGNVAAMNVVTNTGAQTSNLTGITRAFITNYNIQMAGGTLNQFESTAAVASTTAGATGTVTYGYCLSGEFLHANTGGLVITAVDGTLGDITIQSSGDIVQARGIYGYIADTAGQTGVYSTVGVGIQATWFHNAATTWPEAWGIRINPTASGAGAITTLGGGIMIQMRGNTSGAWTNAYNIYVKQPANSTGLFTNIYGQRIDNQGGSATTKAIGMYISDQSGATNNVSLAIGSNSAPATTAALFLVSANPVMVAASTTIGGQTAPAAGIQLFVTTTAAASGTPILTRWTGAAHTGMTIAEAVSIDFNLGQTLTFGAAGSQIGTQRTMRISPPTYTAASGTQDFGTLATFDITNAPNTVAALTTVGNVYCLMVGITGANIANKAGTVYAAIATPAATVTLLNTTQVTSTVGATMLQLGQLTVNQSGGAVTVNQAATLDVVGPPIAGSSVTITTLYAALFRTGSIGFGGLFTLYNNIALGGNGVGSIVKHTRPAQQVNTTVTLATYTTPASDGSYEISANINVTVSTTVTMTVTCAYTDEANVARTLTLPFFILAGTMVQSITTAQGNIAYESVPITIRAKASTSITIATAGTVTTVTYTGEGRIVQMA